MREFPWSAETAEWMRRASDYSSYDSLLAKHIAAHLSKSDTVFEPGCGVGGLTLALAPYVKNIMAVDIAAPALASLKENAAKRDIRNVNPMLCDVMSLSAELRFDAAVFCFFGMPEEILFMAEKHSIRSLFIIKRAYATHRFSTEAVPIKGDSLSLMRTCLEERGIAYTCELLDAEMGQPFRSIEEARRFFTVYARDADKSVFTEAYLKTRLIQTDNPAFPYYLPGKKEVGLIYIERKI